MNKDRITEHDTFFKDNRIKVNGYLNKVLWFFIVTGPAIALGIKAQIFHDIAYSTCLNISIGIAIMAIVHLFLFKKWPNSMLTSAFALSALNILIAYMSFSHVSIYLTWFLCPVLSMLFCNKYLYFFSCILNYILMFVTTGATAVYEADMSTEHLSILAYFTDTIGGFTIEYIIMFVSGIIVVTVMSGYFENIFSQHKHIMQQKEMMNEKMGILGSMAEIYDNVNLIDFVHNTEMSLRDAEQTRHGIDLNAQTHTIMNQRIKNQVMPDQLDAFLEFTNIKTVRSRLSHKKLISADFIDVLSGWFRAQYITVDSTLDGIPNVVIYTTRSVDDEKKREENLIRISLTDEMTRMFNRRCYDEDLKELRSGALSDDFVLFSIDVNGLKTVNDTKGHAAGDELIKGAANCLALSVGNKGKVYRTGGDEFMVVIHTDNPEKLRSDIREKAKEWHGMYTDSMTMSIGYAAYKDHRDTNIDELEHKADADMYADKDRYYKENGIERRRR